jgi:dehydrogenase/reductase SDR family protein 1
MRRLLPERRSPGEFAALDHLLVAAPGAIDEEIEAAALGPDRFEHARRFFVLRLGPLDRPGIINISFWSAQRHLGNTIYGIAKAATDRMTSDMAVELKPYAIPVISLYPGLVQTESVLAAAKSGAFDLSTSESPEFIGRVINALFHDPSLMSRTGQVLVAAAVAREFDVLDIDGSSPPALALEDI